MLPRIKIALGLLLIVPAALLVACGGNNGNEAQGGAAKSTPGTATTVNVTENEYSITPDASTSPTGEVTFKVKNDGTMTHEFVVFRTDLPETQLPVDPATSQVDEEASGVELVDEKEDIAKGKTATLKVDLEPGNYVLICNIAGHYTLGMHSSLAVVAAAGATPTPGQ